MIAAVDSPAHAARALCDLLRPPPLVEAGHAAAEDLEDELEVAIAAGAIDHGEGSEPQGGGEIAAVVAVGACAADDDGGRGLGEPGEDFEQARAALFIVVVAAGFEWEAQVDDGDVDGGGADDFGGLATTLGADGGNAHGLEEEGEALDPGVLLPAGVGEQEVEPAVWLAGP